MGETEEFNTLAFEKKLTQLKDTQESIQSLSSWCLKQRAHHKKIVSSWLNVLKRVKVEQRLVLFYLANDVIQYSKRKNYEFVESWGLNLQKATPLVRDEKVRHKIVRIFKIWELRSVYDDEFLTDLTGLLSAGAIKKTEDDALDFQPQQLVNKIKQCSVLEADTDLRLKYIHESHLQLSDADALCASLKDRRNKDDVEKELSEGIACVERYTQALQREIVARESLLALLTSASQYYSTQRGEVKVVAYAYKNFGARVRALKRKLDELIPTLPNAAPSPPVCDEDVPSPGPDEDLDLPNTTDTADDEVSYNIDKTFNTSLTADGSLYNLGLSSFLSSENPMSIFNNDPPTTTNSNANKIEVISSRPSENQDFLNDILKTLIPNDNTTTSDNNSVASGTMSQKSQDTLPGLDLLTPESTGNAPPISFYGAMDHINDEPEQPYHTASNTDPWSTNVQTWSVPTPVPPPPISTIQSLSSFTSVPSLSSLPSLPPLSSLPIFADTPESPPPAPLSLPPVLAENQLYTPDLPPADVDHRGVLPPPPPPPVLPGLGHMEDVDHRMLPTLPPLPPTAVPPPTRHSGGSQDVDHRNLISLTNQMPPPRQLNAVNMDQDYRVPPMVPHPSDIVESVDMDLSEDEDQLGTYQNQQSQSDLNRRQSFNNKVLVGGNNGKTNHEQQNTNLIRINSIPNAEPKKVDKVEAPLTAPILQPLSNPFDNMPMELKSFNMPFPPKLPDIPLNLDDDIEEKTELYDEDLRSRGQENFKSPKERNPSPPAYETYDPGMAIETNWETQSPQRPFMNRFPRNWTPRSNFRQQFIPQQFWPRNVPRTPNRWMGPRPQRFW